MVISALFLGDICQSIGIDGLQCRQGGQDAKGVNVCTTGEASDVPSLRDLGFVSPLAVNDTASLRDWAEHGCLVVNRIPSLRDLGFMSSIVVNDISCLQDSGLMRCDNDNDIPPLRGFGFDVVFSA
jgi:hypothetical protein